MLRPEAAILFAAPTKGFCDGTGATEPVGAAVPTGAAGAVLLTKVGGGTTMLGAPEGAGAVPTGAEGIGAADGTAVTLTAGALLGTSTGAEEGTTTGADETGAGMTGVTLTAGAEVAGITGTDATGLVTVHGQSVIVRVVAW